MAAVGASRFLPRCSIPLSCYTSSSCTNPIPPNQQQARRSGSLAGAWASRWTRGPWTTSGRSTRPPSTHLYTNTAGPRSIDRVHASVAADIASLCNDLNNHNTRTWTCVMESTGAEGGPSKRSFHQMVGTTKLIIHHPNRGLGPGRRSNNPVHNTNPINRIQSKMNRWRSRASFISSAAAGPRCVRGVSDGRTDTCCYLGPPRVKDQRNHPSAPPLEQSINNPSINSLPNPFLGTRAACTTCTPSTPRPRRGRPCPPTS